MTDRQTLEAYNRAHDITAPGPFRCDHCGSKEQAFALVNVSDLSGMGTWVCGHCISDQDRATKAAAEATNRIPKTSWASEYGAFLKNERNRLLDASRWTIMPDSPLSLTCQLAFVAYLRALQRMTIDAGTTTGWTWPVVPPLQYPPATVSVTVKP